MTEGPKPIEGGYACILIDPPWEYPEGFVSGSCGHGPRKDTVLPYPSMTLDEIQALPVREISASDCRLWLWTTNKYLPSSFSIMDGWGFTYKQTIVWHKSGGNMGGSIAPNSAEFLLVGIRGKPGCKRRFSSSVIVMAPRRHSQKPTDIQWLIEMTTDGPRLEMFARRSRPGWHVWGNEVGDDIDVLNPNIERNVKQMELPGH